eukprot:gnl/TRDRNA2_/TRDRNA2_175353_c0_seq1.p1 gnl/TRDRNA2_/TRDRNA2_175353_c0~~gnl/TRDRNA2_/TRDRNA2_175353_c0_seq1.p1  ORF type:complete len:288 (+),score=-21.40 gnl/TRDRNA2_/TRDRNA2_175353_c0_seq1:288-1151(+)
MERYVHQAPMTKQSFYGEFFSPHCENFSMLQGHRLAVLELHWTQDGQSIISCSPDHTVRAWDAETGKQTKLMGEHEAFVNSCYPLNKATSVVVSGADDGCIKIWDLRTKRSSQTIWAHHPVTSVSSTDIADTIYSGGIDNTIKAWDLRKNDLLEILSGHCDTVTGLCASPDTTQLLSNSADNTLRIWDIRNYAMNNRSLATLTGHSHSCEKTLLKCSWSHDGAYISAGSSDGQVYIWDASSKELIHRLPGHLGSVNEIAFHPNLPVIGSCSSDKLVIIGELDKEKIS